METDWWSNSDPDAAQRNPGPWALPFLEVALPRYMKKRPDKVLLKVEIPTWSRVLYAIAAPPTLLLFLAIAVLFSMNGLTLPGVLISALALVIVGVSLPTIPHIYSTILVTEFGLKWRRPFGLRTKNIGWDDILTVSRPRFRIPQELAYIISKRGENIAIMRSMTGFDDLLAIIETRAMHLSSKQLPINLWPNRRWKHLLLFFTLFLAYVIIRKLLGF